MKLPFRIGSGYDVHRLVEGRKLILGGVEIPFEKGLLGHSDADALLHSICDALLGALALGDIGKHFPDTDPKYKDCDSKVFLSEANRLVKEAGYAVGNVDATIVIERPKMAPYINDMRKIIAGLLETDIENISVKATRSEGMGFAGAGEGVKVYSTVLLSADNKNA